MRLVTERVGLDHLQTCHAIRREVFIDGQQVPEELEIDGLDDVAQHFLARLDDRPVGTARMRIVRGAAKAERVAVLHQARGKGVGRALMQELQHEARRRGLRKVKLSAQLTAIPFYDRLGYTADGPIYLDAGIEHRDMWIDLP